MKTESCRLCCVTNRKNQAEANKSNEILSFILALMKKAQINPLRGSISEEILTNDAEIFSPPKPEIDSLLFYARKNPQLKFQTKYQ